MFYGFFKKKNDSLSTWCGRFEWHLRAVQGLIVEGVYVHGLVTEAGFDRYKGKELNRRILIVVRNDSDVMFLFDTSTGFSLIIQRTESRFPIPVHSVAQAYMLYSVRPRRFCHGTAPCPRFVALCCPLPLFFRFTII